MAPVDYYRDFTSQDHFEPLWNTIRWTQCDDVPRRESWMNDHGLPYTYGTGEYSRTYSPVSWHPFVDTLRHILNDGYECRFDCCFVNGYETGRHHLGWHSDDSPEMDMDHPIAVVSFGAAREIWFKHRGDMGETERLLLEPGSLLLMRAGMQREWMHRIPKSSVHDCGPRLSLTYRRLVV